MALDLAGFAAAAQGASQAGPDTFTAVVVRADASGLWVAPVGDDPRHPVGPCRGGWTPNGTRFPPGAVVMLAMTDEGPWVAGVDNPALAINDSTLAPFLNSSFEQTPPAGYSFVAAEWSDFWSSGRRGVAPEPNTYTATLEEGAAAHGLRALRVDARGTYALVNPNAAWSVPAGSSLELSLYSRGIGPSPRLQGQIYSKAADGGDDPGPFVSGTTSSIVAFEISGDWLRYRATFTLPPTHNRVRAYIHLGAATGTDATVWIDNVDVDLVDIDPAAVHQDFIRRAAAVLAGGGIRTVTAGGNVSWSQPLTIAAAGLNVDTAPEGRFDISMPGNGVVIPVHHSTARTSVTVTGGAILLNPNEALWYELPIGQPAATSSARFHVLASDLNDGYVIPAHWMLVVRRTSWSAAAHAHEYLWGDGRPQDPWRTPALNTGWNPGTALPRFRKEASGAVRLIGRVKDGVGSAFSLPPGYRPTEPHPTIVPDGLNAPALLTISAAGEVTPAGNNTDHSIATTFAPGQ